MHGIDGILVSSSEEYFHRLHSVTAPPPIHSPSPAPIISSDDLKPVSVPSSDAFSPQIVDFPSFSPEIVQVPAPNVAFSSFPPEHEVVPPAMDSFSPEIVGIPPYSPEFKGIPKFSQEVDRISVPSDAFSPGIPEIRSPIGAFQPDFGATPEIRSPLGAFQPDFGAIPASNDAAFTGGGFNSISAPPIDAYSQKNDENPSPSPSIFSPDEYSMSQEYAEWSHTEFLSPNSWSSAWSIPPPFTEEESPEKWQTVN